MPGYGVAGIELRTPKFEPRMASGKHRGTILVAIFRKSNRKSRLPASVATRRAGLFGVFSAHSPEFVFIRGCFEARCVSGDKGIAHPAGSQGNPSGYVKQVSNSR